jgi:hypothetical protein
MSPSEAQSYASQALDPPAFIAAWRAHQGNAAALATTEQYVPPRIEALSAKAQEHAALLQSNAIFQSQYGPNAEIRMIELGRLLAFQWHVDKVVMRMMS